MYLNNYIVKGIIVDTNEKAVKALKQGCASIKDVSILKVFKDKINAASYLQTHPVDFMIVEINLSDSDKLEIFTDLKEAPQTIIATENKHLALDAYEYDFVEDYILKPINQDRLTKGLLRVRHNLLKHETKNQGPKKDDKLFIHIDKKLVKIEVSQILFVEAKGDYITIHTPGKKYTTYSSLKRFSTCLKNHQFIDIHRSYIINPDKIVDLTQNSVVIGKEVLPISRYKRSMVFEQLNQL